MLAWLPSLLSLIIGILGQLNAADWVAAHPNVAMGLGTLGALITALTKSPIEHPKPPAVSGRQFLFVLPVALVLLASPALAQTVTVDLNKSTLAWNWTKGAPPNDGDVRNFVTRCGRQSGVYSHSTPINDPAARSAPIRSIINGQGQWFCVVRAENAYAPSADSNEISFDAGAAPAGPSSLRVQAQ